MQANENDIWTTHFVFNLAISIGSNGEQNREWNRKWNGKWNRKAAAGERLAWSDERV